MKVGRLFWHFVTGALILVIVTLVFMQFARIGSNEGLQHTRFETKSSSSTDPDKSTLQNSWGPISITAMAIATLLSTITCFYLYRWRRILISEEPLLVPEAWGSHFLGLGKEVSNQRKMINERLSQVLLETENQKELINNMIKTYMSLQTALDEKDSEIRRLKKGYDAEIFRRFLYRFVRIDRTIDELIESGETGQESIVMLHRLMEDAFDECGLERFLPNIGDDYRNAEGTDDNPKTSITDRQDEEFQIVEVLEPGYCLRIREKREFITRAKVKILVMEK